jgi:transcriptional regulator with PAS, ATPase and Fis domain
MRLGDAKIIPVDVRVVAATNQNLLDCVNKKLFRLDLFYRLSVLMLEIPALREFREEIPHFLKRMLFEKYRIEKGINLK